MHPQQKAFINAFKSWDAEAMAQALIAITEEIGNVKCSQETQAKVDRRCREFLNSMEHPWVGWHVDFPDVSIELHWDVSAKPIAEHQPLMTYCDLKYVTIRLGMKLRGSPEMLARWESLGFDSNEIIIDRDLVKFPLPFKGELGYEPWPPSPIHVQPVRTPTPEKQTYAYGLSIQDREPKPLLARYLAGEHEQVWQTLIELGDAVRSEEYFADAVAVARETMRRCKANVERLVERLRSMNYVFVYGYEEEPIVPLEPPGPQALDWIADLERNVGPIPLSLCAWHEIVGSVCFIGHLPEWRELNYLPEGRELDEYPYPDPLCVDYRDNYPKYDEANWDYDEDDMERFWYSLAVSGDYYSKEDVSGNGPYTIVLPNAAADAPLEYEWHETEFVNFLRICFRWGGFPGWEREAEDERPNDDLRALTADLLPI